MNVDYRIVTLISPGYFYGLVTYTLRRTDDGDFRIRRQHTLLLNDKIDSVLDFYHV